jgi:hypothetical protein
MGIILWSVFQAAAAKAISVGGCAIAVALNLNLPLVD